MTIWTGIATAFMGSLGFSMMFQNHGRKLLLSALGGGLTWAFYLLLDRMGFSYQIAYFFSAVAAALYAECMARKCKAPATIFLIPSIVPLIPGGSLYYTMLSAVAGELDAFTKRGMQTLNIAISIAVGVVLVSVLFKLYGGKFKVFQ